MFTYRFAPVVRILAGVSLVVALSASVAFAASPSISDAGSAYWTARVSGSGFTPSGYWVTNRAVVWVLNVDPYGDQQLVYQSVPVSMDYCFRWFCSGGGQISATINMNGYQCGSRSAIAYDEASGLWSYWIPLDCA